MSVTSRVRNLVRSTKAGCEYLVLRGAVPDRRDRRDRAILIAPPGAGNIGDQALVEAFITNTPGEIVLVVRSADAFDVPVEDTERVEIVVLPGFIYGSAPQHLAAARFLVREHLGAASQLAVVGADIMDGAYNRRASERRFSFAQRAALAGLDSRILGFSWSARAEPTTVAAARAAARHGVRMLARDPESARRLRELNVDHVVQTADMVFLSERPPAVDRAEAASDPRPIAVLNASGLIAKEHDLTEIYVTAVRELVQHGFDVVLLPHVSRPGNDDILELQRVSEAVLRECGDLATHMTMIDHLVSPMRVRQIARAAEVVVTGRMHLAVMALSEGVPAITLATQGKVEGLLRLFALEELCIAPDRAADTLVQRLLEVLRQRAEMAETVAGNLPEVERLAQRNFELTGS